jgi:hypothetical protein
MAYAFLEKGAPGFLRNNKYAPTPTAATINKVFMLSFGIIPAWENCESSSGSN